MMKKSTIALVLACSACTTSAFLPAQKSRQVPAFFVTTAAPTVTTVTTATALRMSDIVSPFDDSGSDDPSSSGSTATKTLEGPLDLTWENVELVLDGMRSFLIQDGGNVIISEIDGPVVRLELQVRYVSCV